MTNFEKFKKDIKRKVNEMMIDDVIDWLIEHGSACDYCAYENDYTCNDDCEYGVRAYFGKECKK